MRQATLEALVAARAAGRPVALATRIADGAQWLIAPESGASGAANDAPPAVAAAAREALAADASRTADVDGAAIFLHVHNPPWRLLVVGAVHIAQALAPMAAAAGYAVSVIDPRGAFASAERFPGVALSSDWPDEALEAAPLDSRSAVATLTHDPKLDDPALALALRSDAFYIGALGSRRTHAARLERLRSEGFDEAATARIHGPIGLAIGARSPAEIAVAILAEIVATRRRAGARAAP